MRRHLATIYLALLVACSRDPQAAPPPLPSAPTSQSAAAPAIPSAASSSSAPASAPSSRLADGVHEYRGTLGTRTPIAAHLTRSGPAIDGSYVYTGVARPISLKGTIGPEGSLSLEEIVGGKKTGALRLQLEGESLVGTWASPAGDRTFPVHLSPGPAWGSLAHDAGARQTLTAQAQACLADPACPAEDADRLLVLAEEAHDHDVDCFAFVDGEGTKIDLPRARACLARQVGARACERGSSPGLDGAELAVMLIDGVGGKEDIPGARALFEGCFEDFTVRDVLEHAEAKETRRGTEPMSFCSDHGGTTLTWNDCIAREVEHETLATNLAAKRVARGLDPTGVQLLATATTAHRAYTRAVSVYVYEAFIEGSLRNAMALAAERALEHARGEDLKRFEQVSLSTASAADIAQAEKALQTALGSSTFATPSEAEEFKKAQAAWLTYRDAEVASYVHALGPKQGEAHVRDSTRVRLTQRRAKECKEPAPK